MSTYRTVLRGAEFRAVLGAHVFAMLAMIIGDVSLTVLVYQRTSSPLLASLTFAIGFVPMGLGALFLGGVGQNRPSRDVLVACEAVCAGLLVLMAVPGMPIVAMLALLAVKGTIDPIFSGTRAATLPELLGDDGFAYGRSLLRLVSQNAQMVGFAAGGLALVIVTPAQALLTAATGYALSAVVLFVGTRRCPPAGRAVDPIGPVAALRVLLAVPGMQSVLAMSWLPAFFAVAPEALANPYAHRLGEGTVAVGLLLTGLPVGSVLGELLAGSLLTPARRARLVVPLATAGFAPVLLFAVTPSLPVTMALLVLAGLTTSYFIGLDQLALATVPEDLRRRGFALQSAGMMVTQGLGFATAGALAEWLPVNAVIPIVAACGIVVALVVGLGLRRAHPAARRRETATA
ncbi:MAG: hypothetical protein QOG20_1811 [Pseudonocardiales bacterium]|nr:hypothetical protein [Pseudonocardiales bacterium]